jgi:AraC-like DNA-binding protein
MSQGIAVTGNGMTAVERAELHTTDMDLLAGMVRQQYAGHAATFRCADPAMVDGQLRTATAGGLTAGLLGYDGFEYTAQLDPVLAPTTVTILRGTGSITAGGREQRFTAGDVIMLPADRPSLGQTMTGIRYATLQIPWAALHALAEEGAGIRGQSLRFDSTAPLSTARQRAYASTAVFICEQLLTSGTTEVHPLLTQSMTGLAAAAMLETFPNTTMTAPCLPGPGWVTPASVRQAAEFIHAHAGEPVAVADIAVAAGLTPRALRYAFRSRYDLTTAQYQRQVRLERAHLELLSAGPGDGVTVAGVARKWGWASPSRFTAAYRRRFLVPPSHTLRN